VMVLSEWDVWFCGYCITQYTRSYRAVVLDWCGRLDEEPGVGRREQAKLQEMKGISPSCGDTQNLR